MNDITNKFSFSEPELGRSSAEIYDLNTIGLLADEHGYGNVINFLQRRWADMLMKKYNMTPTGAAIGAGMEE